MRRLFILTAGLLLTAGLSVDKAWAQGVEQESVVALFGDSITVGENVTSYYSACGASGQPSQRGDRPGFGLGRTNFCTPDRALETLLDESKRPTTVVNWGIGGTLTGTNHNNGMSRIESNLNQSKSAYPNRANYFVLIFYGTNDVGRGVSPNAIATNIAIMIDRARDVGWTPIVGNLLPRSAVSVTDANDQIRSVAIQKGAPFVDQFTNFNNNGGFALHDDESVANISERLHPSEEGYQVVAKHWFDAALENLIALPEPDPIIAPIIYLLLDDE